MAYQHEEYIRHALDGIVNQTSKSFKLIAIDDGSTDKTFSILKEYEAGPLNGKMTVLTHPGHQNFGIYAGYQRCLENLDTEFFMAHASDDLLKPQAIEYLLKLMDANPNADFAYGICEAIDELGHSLGYVEGSVDIGDGLTAFLSLLRSNPIREPSMFYRRSCSSVILDDCSGIVYGDWLHNLSFFSLFKPQRYDHAVAYYRLHKKNTAFGISQCSSSHVQRCKAVIAAALDCEVLMGNPARKALLFIAGTEAFPKTSRWPSLLQRLKFICLLPKSDCNAVVCELLSTYLAPSTHPFLVLALVYRVSSNHKLRLIYRYISSLLQLPASGRSFVIR